MLLIQPRRVREKLLLPSENNTYNDFEKNIKKKWF